MDGKPQAPHFQPWLDERISSFGQRASSPPARYRFDRLIVVLEGMCACDCDPAGHCAKQSLRRGGEDERINIKTFVDRG